MKIKRFLLPVVLALLVFVVIWIPALFSARFWSAIDGTLIYTRGSALANFVFQVVVAMTVAAGVSSVLFKMSEKLRHVENSTEARFRARLEATQGRLKDTQTELTNTQEKLTNTQAELDNTQTELTNTQKELNNKQAILDKLTKEGLAEIIVADENGEEVIFKGSEPMTLGELQKKVLKILIKNPNGLTLKDLAKAVYGGPDKNPSRNDTERMKSMMHTIRTKINFVHHYITMDDGEGDDDGKVYVFNQSPV